MTIRLVSFATSDMSLSLARCSESALQHNIHVVDLWGEARLKDTDFFRRNEPLFQSSRGFGFWSWKPYIILAGLAECDAGDVLVYSDAGVEFINNVNYLIDRMDSDVLLFANLFPHAHWCKRDVIETIWPERKANFNNFAGESGSVANLWASFGNQIQASVIVFHNTERVHVLVEEWLKLCQVPHLIDDSPSVAPNHPEFREHRHDQAILTTLAYRDGIKLHWWPAKYDNQRFEYPKGPFKDNYPAMFDHHRRRNQEWRRGR